MRKLRMIGATCALILASLTLVSPAQAADTSLLTAINGLTVAAEQDAGYDRELFGDYDRDAMLAANFAAWPDCDGYYSAADDKCYTDASEVDVDHMVALKEAWGSGAHAWSADKLDVFAGDTDNLWLMTDNLNSSKGDDDFAEWTPRAAVLCDYLAAYVAVKVKYALSVDMAEKTKLVQVAKTCAPKSEPTKKPTKAPTTTPAAAPGAGGSGDGGDLPVTGVSVPAMAGVGALLLAAGGALVLARRRKVNFTA